MSQAPPRRVTVVGEGTAAAAAELVAAAGPLARQPVVVERVADAAGLAAIGADRHALPDLVIEASPDAPVERKAAAVAALLDALPGRVPIAVVARLPMIADLLPGARDGARVVGLHPVAGRLVEVAMPAWFDDVVVDGVLDLLDGAGLVALPCTDAPGRIVDRLVAAARLEAVAHAGRDDPGHLEVALGTEGLPLHVLASADLPAVAAALHEGLGDAHRFLPPTPPTLAAGLPTSAIMARVCLAVIAEAYRLVGEAVAGAEDIERAMTLGAGWATGPFALAGRAGLRTLVTELTAAARAPDADLATADRFRVPPVLWQIATV